MHPPETNQSACSEDSTEVLRSGLWQPSTAQLNHVGRHQRACAHRTESRTYFPAEARSLLTVLNVELSCDPSVLTTAMMATEMPAAIKPYSIAVAPD